MLKKISTNKLIIMNILKTPILNIKNESSNLVAELATVKKFLKVDFEDDDELIKKLIITATNQCETYIDKTLTKKTYVYSIYSLKNESIFLPYPIVISIDKVEVVSADNKKEEFSDYFFDNVGGIVNFVNKPSNFYRIDITYTAGATLINDEIIQAILMHIARMYEDRSGYSPMPLNTANIYKKYKQVRL